MNSLKYHIIFFALLSGLYSGVSAQKSIRDSSISVVMLSINYGGYSPSGDFAERFGYTHMMGADVGYKFVNNFYVKGGAKFLFGRTVKEWVAQNVTTAVFDENGNFQIMAIGSDGRWYEVRYFERGFVVPLTVGKIFPVFKKHNPNSGIYVELGGQFMLHKIKIEPRGNNVPSLDPEYRPGYDRLTSGFGLTEGIGYKYFGSKRLSNFYLGLDLSQNFTQNQRTVNWDTGMADTKKRLDMLIGFKVGWMFPIYKQAGDDFYIN